MTWRPKLTTIPPKDEMEPDRRLGDLIRYLRGEPDCVRSAVWFIESLAGEFGLPLHIGSRDPLENWKRLSIAAVWALHQAGEMNRERRPALADTARSHLLEIFDQLKFWREEVKEKDPIHKQGNPVAPTTPDHAQPIAEG